MGEVTTEAALASLSYSVKMILKLWCKLQNLFVKICLIMKTKLNLIFKRILKTIPKNFNNVITNDIRQKKRFKFRLK